MKSEIILYQPESSVRLEVRMEDETVWLNRNQIAILFDRDVKTISKHINNALAEELADIPVVANFATTASDGKNYNVQYFNIEMITSIGYRVKSKRGTQFRIWANKILKDYLLKGYAINQRVERLEEKVFHLEEKSKNFELVIKTTLPPKEGLFFDGQVYDAFDFVKRLIQSAEKSIILIDNYIDNTVLTMFADKKAEVEVVIYTKSINSSLLLAEKKFNEQYGILSIKEFSFSHDRFLIIDEKEIFLIGASLKDLGKKWFAVAKLDEMNIEEFKKRLLRSRKVR